MNFKEELAALVEAVRPFASTYPGKGRVIHDAVARALVALGEPAPAPETKMTARIEWKDPDFAYSVIKNGTAKERRAIGRKGEFGEYFEIEIEFDAKGNITGGKFFKKRG